MSVFNLPIPPEPTSIKESFKKDMESNSRLTKANIKQGTWIATLLWNDFGWGDILKNNKISWQIFMKAVSANYYSFLRWVEGEKTWKEAMEDLIQLIDEYRRF